MQIQKISNFNNRSVQANRAQSQKTNYMSKVNLNSTVDGVSFTGMSGMEVYSKTKSLFSRFPEIFKHKIMGKYYDDIMLIVDSSEKSAVDKVSEYRNLMAKEYYEIINSAAIQNVDNFIIDLFKFRDRHPYHVEATSTEIIKLRPKEELLTKNALYLEPTGLEKNPELHDFFRAGHFKSKMFEHNGKKYFVRALNQPGKFDGIIAEFII